MNRGKRGWRVAAFLAFVLGLSVAAGCGGSGDSLTKAAFIDQGDAICAKAESRKNVALEKAFSQQRSTSGKAYEEELVTEVALPPISQMTAELADLGTPDEGGDQAREIVAAFEDGVQKLEADPASVLDGSNPFANADKLAGEYGFGACSEI